MVTLEISGLCRWRTVDVDGIVVACIVLLSKFPITHQLIAGIPGCPLVLLVKMPPISAVRLAAVSIHYEGLPSITQSWLVIQIFNVTKTLL